LRGAAFWCLSLLGLVTLACGGSGTRQPGTPGVQITLLSATPTAEGTPTPMLPPPPLLANAQMFQNIPTYDGSEQVVHPDVVYFPGRWHGYKYWMAITPYPYGDDHRENPGVVVSDDGVDWLVPPGVTNPLIPPPACDHNSDPDLVYHPGTGELYFFYTEQQRGERCDALNENHLRLLKSSDGVHWSVPQTVLSWDLAKAPLYLSPGVVYRSGSFELWLAGNTGVARATSNDGIHWSALEPVRIDAAPWHLDVQYVEARSEYWMLFVDSPLAGSKLRVAMSKDGIAWNVYPAPLLVPGPVWDDERIYRATFLYGDNGVLRVWYSASSRLGVWHVGYAEIAADRIASRSSVATPTPHTNP
jgi:hypothetical protein